MTSTLRDAIRQQLMAHEGTGPRSVNGRLSTYQDSRGLWTIGYGRLIDGSRGGGITDAEARYLLDNDINAALNDLQTLVWFPSLDPVRQRVFIDLCFNMGLARLKGFVKMLAAASRLDWNTAATELLDSRYAVQVGPRAHTLAAMLRTGQA